MMKILTVSNLLWLTAYLVLMGGGAWGMHEARDWAGRELRTPQAQTDWQQWRDETRRQRDGQGPVTRQVAKSAQPPTLVMLSDHFATCLAAILLLGSVLFFSLMWMLRGALSAPTVTSTEEPRHTGEIEPRQGRRR